MGASVFFDCETCGTCCRNLLEEREGVLKGLALTAKERSLFPNDMVSPLTAVGKSTQEHMIEYQLNVNDCPHIDDKNECRIYDSRPLICRAFPFVEGDFSIKCPVLKRIFGKAGLRVTFPVPDAEVEAVQKLNRYFQNRLKKHLTKGARIWMFDLATRQWEARAQRV